MDTGFAGRDLSTLPSGAGSLVELARDLTALGGAEPEASARWTTRPAVLRRVAMALADGISADATRIVVAGEAGIALGAALSLTTGLPYAVVGTDGPVTPVLGELHVDEDLAIATVHEHDLDSLVDRLDAPGGPGARCVFGTSTRALFSIVNGQVDERGAQ